MKSYVKVYSSEITQKVLLRVAYGVQSDYKNICKEKLVYDYVQRSPGRNGRNAKSFYWFRNIQGQPLGIDTK